MSMKQKLLLTLVLLATIPMLISVIGSTIFAHDIARNLLIEQAREKLITVRELKKLTSKTSTVQSGDILVHLQKMEA